MNDAQSTLVVPVDGSPAAADAVRHAAMLAKVLPASLQLLHVAPDTPARLLGTPSEMADFGRLRPLDDKTLRQLQKRAGDEALERARAALPEGTGAEDVRLLGDPATAISDHASGISGARIVIGARGRGRLTSLVLGSVSHQVIHGASCPVTVVRENAPALDPDAVIVPADGSAAAFHAVQLGVQTALRLGITVHLVHVFAARPADLPGLSSSTGGMLIAELMQDDRFQQLARDSARTVFDNIYRTLGETNASFEEHLLHGHAADSILRFAEDNAGQGLIFMGRRGLGQVREVMLGSVSHGVIHGATNPVTVTT